MTRYNKQDIWNKVARVVMAMFITALGALFLLELAVVFRNESVGGWVPFAMSMGSLFWSIAVTILFLEWKTNSHKLNRPNLFLTVGILCVLLLGVSLSPVLVGTMKTFALIADAVIVFFFLSTFVNLYFEEFWKKA